MSSMHFLRAGAALVLSVASLAAHAVKPVTSELTPDNSVLMLIDYQPQFLFATHSIPESSPGDYSPRPSQNRTCSFPASGSQFSSFA